MFFRDSLRVAGYFFSPAAVLLSSFVASHSSSSCSLFSICVAPDSYRDFIFLFFTQQLSKTPMFVGATLQMAIGISSTIQLWPHPSFPSPSEKGRCCIDDPNDITITSTLYRYSTFQKCLISIILFKRLGLCVDGLP